MPDHGSIVMTRVIRFDVAHAASVFTSLTRAMSGKATGLEGGEGIDKSHVDRATVDKSRVLRDYGRIV